MIAYKISFSLGGKKGHVFAPEHSEFFTSFHNNTEGIVFTPAKELSQIVLFKLDDHIDGGFFRINAFGILPVISIEIVEGNELPPCVVRLLEMQDQDCFVVGHIKAEDSGTDKDRYVVLKIFDEE